MVRQTVRARAQAILLAALLLVSASVARAQQSPVAAMFNDDQKRDKNLAASFLVVEVPAPKTAGSPLQVYLSAGDLQRAFDRPEFRPDGSIVPTNAELQLDAPSPATQRVLMDRVRKAPDVMRDLQEQIAARKGTLNIGVDTVLAELPRNATQSAGAFPRFVCLIPTDFAKGGAIDSREYFTQDRVRKGIAGCLTALDAAGVRSVIMPLMGAASSGTQSKDTRFEGQRLLKECRLLNSVAGIALGFHDFAANRRNIREIGMVQWDQEISDMFSVPPGSSAAASARRAYQTFADQVKAAFRKGLAGEHTSATDVDGNCITTFNAK
jgi:hypothetical protein